MWKLRKPYLLLKNIDLWFHQGSNSENKFVDLYGYQIKD